MESIPEWVGNRDLVVGPALFRLGGAGEDAPRAQDVQRIAYDGTVESEDENDAQLRWVCPLDERRSICPISGEPFERTWSSVLNDWVHNDVVAVEVGSTKPLRFPPGGPTGPHGLSETAVLFKKSCFFNPPPLRRVQALEECKIAENLVVPGGAPISDAPVQSEDPE